MDSLAGLIIGVYARFSSENQRDTSIDDQVKLARDFTARHGGALAGDLILTDYAVSGVSRARDAFERLLRLIEERKLNLVVTESASRLSRDLGDADRLWKLCEFHGTARSREGPPRPIHPNDGHVVESGRLRGCPS